MGIDFKRILTQAVELSVKIQHSGYEKKINSSFKTTPKFTRDFSSTTVCGKSIFRLVVGLHGTPKDE